MKKLYVVVLFTLIVGLMAGCSQNKANSLLDADFRVTGYVNNQVGWSTGQLKSMETILVQQIRKDRTKENREGVLIATLLHIAQVKEGATTVTFKADDYTVDVPLDALMACEDCIVAMPKRRKDGLETVMPNFAGKTQVRGIIEIEVQLPPTPTPVAEE